MSETTNKRSHDEPDPAAKMPRIPTTAEEELGQKIEAARARYPFDHAKLNAMKSNKTLSHVPAMPDVTMNGSTIQIGSDPEAWLKFAVVCGGVDPEGIVGWGAGDYPEQAWGIRMNIPLGPLQIKFLEDLQNKILDTLVAANGGPTMPKAKASKLKELKSIEEKRSFVRDAVKLHLPLKGDSITIKFRLLETGVPNEDDAEHIKCLPESTQTMFNNAKDAPPGQQWRYTGRTVKAADGKTDIPIHLLTKGCKEGRPVLVFQGRVEILIKCSIKLDPKRINTVPMAGDFQLLALKPQGGSDSGPTMPSLLD